MDLYAAVCYFISKKLNEIIIIDISFVSKIILKNKYSHKENANAEIDICKLLHFDLASNTNNSLRNKEREYSVLMLNAFLKNIKVLEKKEYSKLCKVIYKKGII